ncbi:MAG: hypothetical protein DRI44_04325 [Chlamydiae bacterium]|nr:MAG: hypothetical protein DRI44_04325 [Chlamydiota bacterium]
MRKIKIIVVGAGDRGNTYASRVLKHSEKAEIAGVAEPREKWRERLARNHNIPSPNIAEDWRELVSKPKFADAVIIATQDSQHKEPAIAFAKQGYHILLEKPMAPDEESCRQIVSEVLKAEVIFAVCHDLDWIHYVMNCKCTSIQSFGTLKHFRAEQKPEGAADRCVNCSVEPKCPYSAKRFYIGCVKKGATGWPVSVITPEVNEASVMEALRVGPYGRCVYNCDNDKTLILSGAEETLESHLMVFAAEKSRRENIVVNL